MGRYASPRRFQLERDIPYGPGNPDYEYDKRRQEIDDMEPKLCRDCGNFQGNACIATKNMTTDLVNGGVVPRVSPQYLRAADTLCGPEARWFVRKDYVFGQKVAA